MREIKKKDLLPELKDDISDLALQGYMLFLKYRDFFKSPKSEETCEKCNSNDLEINWCNKKHNSEVKFRDHQGMELLHKSCNRCKFYWSVSPNNGSKNA